MSELYDESKIIKLLMIKAVMLSPCGQVGLEAKIMSSSSSLSSKIWPGLGLIFVIIMSLNFLFGPCEIVCNASIGNISEFAMVS